MTEPIEHIRSREENEKYQEKMSKLFAKKAIEKCIESKKQFVSSYFLVPKPDSTNRFIINSKNFNEFLKPVHFKLEDLRSANNLVFPNFFMSTLDLKDAYCYEQTVNKILKSIISCNFIKIFYYHPSEVFYARLK